VASLLSGSLVTFSSLQIRRVNVCWSHLLLHTMVIAANMHSPLELLNSQQDKHPSRKDTASLRGYKQNRNSP